jgi:tight adherence protein B
VVGINPYAVAFGVVAIIVLIGFAFSGNAGGYFKRLGEHYKLQLDRADLTIKPEEFGLIVLSIGAIAWVVLALVLRVNPISGAVLFPICIALAALGGNFFLRSRGDRRVSQFTQQLELCLRMMAGALRVGLGLRQAIILVSDEVPDPARREFRRVVGRTNVGASILDALDELSASMPSHEMVMLSRAIRVQAQTGGDLSRVLETLATTIRDRRRIQRKMRALTAQGRGGAWIIGSLPVVVGGFVIFTQPDMGGALLHTQIGWIALGIVAVLEILAIYSLSRILQFDV